MGKHLALRRARKTAIGVVVGALVMAGLVSLSGGAAAADVSPDLPPLLQRDGNVVTSDPIPTVQIDNGYVWSQTTIGSTVYAVGKFDNAREPKAAPGTALTARSNVLAYDITTGALLPFAPQVNGVIKAVTASPDGSRIYIGGSFSSVNGQARWNIAALDATTGALVPGFVPSIGGSGVYALTTSGSSVYAGGLFTQANGTARKNLAAFDATDGAVLGWAPQTDLQVDALVMDPAGADTVIGGRFSQINGDTGKNGIAAVDKATGAVDAAWEVPNTIHNGLNGGVDDGMTGIFALATDATGVYGTGWSYGLSKPGSLEGTFAAEAGTGKIRWIADCLGDHYGVYSTGKVVYTTNHTHACSTMNLQPEQNPRTFHYAEAYTADARGTLGHQTNTSYYKDWAGSPAPSPYAWTPDWAVGVTSGLGQAGLSITGVGDMISVGGEFRSVNNGQFEGLVRFSTNPPGGAKDKPRLSGADWRGTAVRATDDPSHVTVSLPADWDRDDLTLTYELHRSGTAAPVATVEADATWWNRPDVTLVDPAAPAATTLQYTVVAKDRDGNSATSAPIVIDEAVTILSRVSGKVVGVSGAIRDTPAVQQTFSGDASQEWKLNPKGNGTFEVKNTATGECLAVGGPSADDGALVVQYDCLGESNFLWSLKDAGEGYTHLVAAHSGKCLAVKDADTADGATFVQNDCASTPAANTQFTVSSPRATAIVSRVSGKVVGVPNWERDAPTVQQTFTGDAMQQWNMIPHANGAYELKNTVTGKCLAVGGPSMDDGASVVQYDCLGESNFLWTLKDAGDGYRQLVASHSGKCLALNGGDTADGATFVQYDCAAAPAANMQFMLRPTS
ncbi:RICIN domain-containing protein [Microbacterium sp. NPDC028030]|uniref:RICIN domain-containing protein n=1 Tax=Microbacterium sp. NPDC028030 TaxID=3155124 RepID=UPI0033E98CEC